MSYTPDHAGFTARFEAPSVERTWAPIVLGGLALCTAAVGWYTSEVGLDLGSVFSGLCCLLAWWGLVPHVYRAFLRDTLILAHGDLVVERRLLRTQRIPLQLRGLRVFVREQDIGGDNQRIDLVLSGDEVLVLNATFWPLETVHELASALREVVVEEAQALSHPEAPDEIRALRGRQEA